MVKLNPMDNKLPTTKTTDPKLRHGVDRAQPASLCGGFTSRLLGPNHPGDMAALSVPVGSLVEGCEAGLGGVSRRVVVVALS